MSSEQGSLDDRLDLSWQVAALACNVFSFRYEQRKGHERVVRLMQETYVDMRKKYVLFLDALEKEILEHDVYFQGLGTLLHTLGRRLGEYIRYARENSYNVPEDSVIAVNLTETLCMFNRPGEIVKLYGRTESEPGLEEFFSQRLSVIPEA